MGCPRRIGNPRIQADDGTTNRSCKNPLAMLNHKGGRVIFGVDQNGRVVGKSVPDKTIEDVVHEIRGINPPVYPHIDRVSVGHGNEVIVETVKKGTKAPYSINGQAYKRVGTTKKIMTVDESEEMILERHQAILSLLGGGQEFALREINEKTERKSGLRALRDDLLFLKHLELIESKGQGRGARWFLKGRRK